MATSDAELRAKLAVASCDDLHRFNVVPGVACTDCQRHADALMPVVRAHSAEAWDDGYDLGQDDMLVSRDFSRDFSRDARRPNPWRGDDQ